MAMAVIIRELCNDTEWLVALAFARSNVDTNSSIFVALTEPIAVLDDTDHLSRGGYAPHCLTAAIHFVHWSTDFSNALHSSLDFAGAANYCPVLVAVLAEARWGGCMQLANMVDRKLVDRVAKAELDLSAL